MGEAGFLLWDFELLLVAASDCSLETCDCVVDVGLAAALVVAVGVVDGVLDGALDAADGGWDGLALALLEPPPQKQEYE